MILLVIPFKEYVNAVGSHSSLEGPETECAEASEPLPPDTGSGMEGTMTLEFINLFKRICRC